MPHKESPYNACRTDLVQVDSSAEKCVLPNLPWAHCLLGGETSSHLSPLPVGTEGESLQGVDPGALGRVLYGGCPPDRDLVLALVQIRVNSLARWRFCAELAETTNCRWPREGPSAC